MPVVICKRPCNRTHEWWVPHHSNITFASWQYSDYLARALQRKVVDSDGVSRMLGMAECIYMSYLDGSAPLQVLVHFFWFLSAMHDTCHTSFAVYIHNQPSLILRQACCVCLILHGFDAEPAQIVALVFSSRLVVIRFSDRIGVLACG